MFKNKFKTILLLGLLTALFLWIGSFWGASGLVIGLCFALIINFGSYFYSDKIVLKIYRAKEIKKTDNPMLYDLVREVADLAKMPMPKIFIIPSMAPNAFATGRNPKHSVVAFTKGLMDLLTKEELKGVIAHEMAHIKNRDILITTIASTIAGVISYIAMVARWSAMFGGFGGRDREGGNLVSLLVLAIITPIIAMLLQMAISRSREFLADETGAKIIKNPMVLASALEKLQYSSVKMEMGTEATSSLFIVNPFKGKSLLKLLSTHPSTEERVKRLRKLVM